MYIKSIEEFCKISSKENKPVRVVNASKWFTISEHLVNNKDCASIYNIKKFKIIKKLTNISY